MRKFEGFKKMWLKNISLIAFDKLIFEISQTCVQILQFSQPITTMDLLLFKCTFNKLKLRQVNHILPLCMFQPIQVVKSKTAPNKAQQPQLHFQLQRHILDFERWENIIEIWDKDPDLDQ